MPLYITFNELQDLVNSNLKVVVFGRASGMGDAITILPAITALRKKLGQDIIFVMLASSYLATVFEHNDCLDFIVSYSREQIDSFCNVRHINYIKQIYVPVHDFEHECPCGVHEVSTAISKRRSRVEIFAEHCGVEFDINNYNFKLHADDLDSPQRLNLPDRYIAVGVRSSGLWKDYRYMKWLTTYFVKLGKKYDFQVVTLDQDIKFCVKGVIGLAGETLSDVYGVLAGSLATVSMCSGYAHVAGALEVPVFGLYGPTPPNLFLRYKKASWLPKFKRCKRQYCWYTPCKVKPCLSIHPKKVLNLFENAMKGFDVI